MRIWDIHPRHLCRKNLLGEHRELHGLWNILTKHKGQGGYSHHPETKRWVGALKALYARHGSIVTEMSKRGYIHSSPLDKRLAKGKLAPLRYISSKREQVELLRNKSCDCFLK